MTEINGVKYVSTKVFGITVAVMVVVFGFIYSVAVEGIDRARNNEVSIGRFEEKFESIKGSLESIEGKLDNKQYIIKDSSL